MSDYKLLPWIDESKLTTIRLCRNKNPLAFEIIKKRLGYMTTEDWHYLCQSYIAKDYLTDNLHKVCDIDDLAYNRAYAHILRHNKTLHPDYKKSIINWRLLSLKEDYDAIYLLKSNIDKIDWHELSSNSKALYILQEHPDKIDHEQLWMNKNPNKVFLLDLSRCETIATQEFLNMANKDDERYNMFIIKNLDAIILKMNYKIPFTAYTSINIRHISNNSFFWEFIANKRIIRRILETYKDVECPNLSARPDMIDIIMEYKDRIDWRELSRNPAAISILKDNPDRIDWSNLSLNTGAIELLKGNIDKIDWKALSENDNAYDILVNNKDKIDWNTLIHTNNPVFKELLESNLDKMDETTIMDAALKGSEWKMRMLMDYDFKEDYEDSEFVSNWIAEEASTDLHFEFIRKHFEEEHYYDILGENHNIFC